MADIVKVWGTCDERQVEFKHEGGITWSCVVPPDFKDGVYAAEFFAIDALDRLGHWSGFLYMSSGVCHFKIKEEKIKLWFVLKKYEIEIKDSKYKIFFKKGCRHWEH